MGQVRRDDGFGWQPGGKGQSIVEAETEQARILAKPLPTPVAVRLTWSSRSPFEVRAKINHLATGLDAPDTPEWMLSREQLADGGGLGDVRITHLDEHTFLVLSNPEGHAEFELPRSFVRTFVERCALVMPCGSEPESEWLSDARLAGFVEGDW